MGITIHYEFAFKGTEEEAKAKLLEVRRLASVLPLESLGDLRPIPRDHNECEEQDEWAAIEYRQHRYPRKRCRSHPGGILKGAEWGQNEGKPCYCSYSVPPVQGFYFEAWAGEGCESSNIGLARYPGSRKNHWTGGAFTKTQYAENFGEAHVLVCALLDICNHVGILRRVNDEAGYWKNRDAGKLAVEWAQSTAFIGGIARKLAAHLGPDMTLGGGAIDAGYASSVE